MKMRRWPLRGVGLLVCCVFSALSVSTAGAAAPAAAWTPTLAVGVQGTDHINAFGDGAVYEFHTAGGVHGFWRSKDFGQTWLPLPDPPEAASGPTAFVSATSGFAASDSAVYRSTDAGQSWQKTTALPVPRNRFPSIEAVGAAKHSKTIVAFGQVDPPLHLGCNFPEDSAFWTSHDSGATWHKFSMGTFRSSFRIQAYDDSRAVAVVYDYSRGVAGCSESSSTTDVYVTTNGGKSWAVGLHCPSPNPCTAAAFISKNLLLAGDVSGSTFVSSNAGRSFVKGTRFSSPAVSGTAEATSFWVQGIAFASPMRGWLSVKGIGTYVTSDGGHSWTIELSQDQVFGLGVGDADAADYEHAVIAGPTLVSARVPVAAPHAAAAAQPGGAASLTSEDGRITMEDTGRVTSRLLDVTSRRFT